jgi:hypothetical protein
MNILLLIILTISFLIIYYIIKAKCICCNWIKEQFDPLYFNQNDDYEELYVSNTNNQPAPKLTKVDCCLVEKKYLPNSAGLFGGDFSYVFTKKTNEQCENNLYNLNSNQQLLIDGDNNWSNDFCSENLTKKSLTDSLGSLGSLGSCRNMNKECIDFVNKDFCDKYKMKWSDKTCHTPSDYTWVDPIKFKLPAKLNHGTFKMF